MLKNALGHGPFYLSSSPTHRFDFRSGFQRVGLVPEIPVGIRISCPLAPLRRAGVRPVHEWRPCEDYNASVEGSVEASNVAVRRLGEAVSPRSTHV